MKYTKLLQTISFLLCSFTLVKSFAPTSYIVIKNERTLSTAIFASQKPTFNESTGKWEPSPSETEELYGPIGSLLRQGPGPFIVRLTKPEEYIQAVLKYQATDGCSLLEAQGNMDAYFNNAADWAYQKSEEKRGAPKADYTELRIQDAVLAVTWAVLIVPILARYVYVFSTTGSLESLLDF